MVNKKGWLKIVEVLIAALLIIGSLLVVVIKNSSDVAPDELCKIIPSLLDEIAKDNSMRDIILTGDSAPIKASIDGKTGNPGIVSVVKICNPDDELACALDEGGLENTDVCAGERIISTSPSQADVLPKKVKLFLYRS